MSRRRQDLPARVLGIFAAGLLLAGCAEPLPEPAADPVPATPAAAVTSGQVDDVLADVATALAAADEADALDPAATRVTGPAATIRTAQYVLARAGAPDAVTPVPTASQTVITPATDSWPRVLMVVTEPPEDLQAPLLVAMVQDAPRDPYRLWSWSRLFPGTQMPATAQPDLGSAPVDPEAAAALLVPPDDVVARYVDVLANGDASEHAGLFPVDPLRENLAGVRQAYQAAAANGGSLTETTVPLEEGTYAVGTADGGAIVVGGFRTVMGIALQDSTLTVGPQTAVFLGGTTTLATNLELTFVGTVAFYVPPADSEEQQVQLLGSEFATTGASGS